MKNKNNFFDRFFHLIAGIVDIHAFMLICNSMIDSTQWAYKEWSSVTVAIIVTTFMIVYQKIRDNDDQNDNPPMGQSPNISIENLYYKRKCSK